MILYLNFFPVIGDDIVFWNISSILDASTVTRFVLTNAIIDSASLQLLTECSLLFFLLIITFYFLFFHFTLYSIVYYLFIFLRLRNIKLILLDGISVWCINSKSPISFAICITSSILRTPHSGLRDLRLWSKFLHVHVR